LKAIAIDNRIGVAPLGRGWVAEAISAASSVKISVAAITGTKVRAFRAI
jgi:hypothetical protein